jgi:prevent-host-death family protein
MADVPIEILKERLSEYLERAREGEQIFITEHGRSIALLAGADPVLELPRSGPGSTDLGPRATRLGPRVE